MDDLVMHGPAVEGVRMADEAGFIGRPVFGLLELRLQISSGSFDVVRLDAPRQLVGPVIGELHVDAEIRIAEQLDGLLQDVAVAPADAHQVALNGGLHFQLAVLDFLDDLAGLLDRNALL